MRALSLALPLLAALAPAPAGPDPGAAKDAGGGPVALRAGTVYLVEDGTVLENGTVLVRGGRITAAGTDLEVPPGTQLVDYGPDAVIVPGLVAASSPFALGSRPAASPRTADPGLLASDGFDFYESHASDLACGVTSAYANPAQGRLIAGQGGVFKLAGSDPESRTLRASAAIHGSISSDARRVGVFWEIPIPPTADVGIGEPQRQYPGSTMGAIWALGELLDAAREGREADGFGPDAAADLAPLVERSLPWRIRAETRMEIRALADFAAERHLPVLIEGASQAGDLGEEIAAAGAAVIFDLPYTPERPGRNLGTHADTVWPEYDVAARLVADGVRVAFATEGSTRYLRFAAAVCSRGGLDPAAALRAITLTPAELLGVADRVGSIRAGKDADLVVLNGPPLEAGSSVLATWVGGNLAWSAPAAESQAVVLAVDELHVGDGTVIAPAQVLLRDGRIAEVGPRVARPAGARIVHGAAAMPGMIDALGHLGLEGTSKVPSTDYEMSRLVAPGDVIDRRVANAGVTTVALSPRRESKTGAPVMVYKPAAVDPERSVVADPAALRLSWKESNRLQAGEDVRKLLEKAVEYDKEWSEYETAMASWTPPPPEPEKVSKGDDEDAKDENGKDEDAEKEGKKDKKDKKKKKDGPEFDPDPATGIWTASVARPPMAEEAPLRLQIRNADGTVEGVLRCSAISSGLVEVSGTYERVELEPGDGDDEAEKADKADKADEDADEADEAKADDKSDDKADDKDDDKDAKKDRKKKSKKGKKDEPTHEQRLVLTGLGTEGYFTIEGLISDDVEDPELAGTLAVGGASLQLAAKRETRDYPVARLPEWRKPPEEEKVKPPKGMPKEPRRDSKLEPMRSAIHGHTAVIVEVDREDEILDCVDAFEAAGIAPVLLGGEDAHKVADRIRGRVRGVLLDPQVVETKARWGTRTRNRYADLQDAGIPVAFHSSAEEGAADLPLMAAYAVSEGMSASGAVRALTADAAAMLGIGDRVGRIAPGLAADVLLLDGSPLDLSSQVVRTFVNGVEIP